MTTMSAPVDLSQYHAGQAVEHHAEMRAEGHDYPDGVDAFGRAVYRWRPTRWQAVHTTVDRAVKDGREVVTGPWCASMDEAEAWLERRGLRIGGAYWHAARPD